MCHAWYYYTSSWNPPSICPLTIVPISRPRAWTWWKWNLEQKCKKYIFILWSINLDHQGFHLCGSGSSACLPRAFEIAKNSNTFEWMNVKNLATKTKKTGKTSICAAGRSATRPSPNLMILDFFSVLREWKILHDINHSKVLLQDCWQCMGLIVKTVQSSFLKDWHFQFMKSIDCSQGDFLGGNQEAPGEKVELCLRGSQCTW